MSNNLWSELVADLGDDMAAAVKDELLRGWQVDAVLAATRQKQIAQASERLEQCAIEGIGQKEMSIDATAYWSWDAAEPGCRKDRAFRDWFKKHNPETVVPYTPRKTTVLI